MNRQQLRTLKPWYFLVLTAVFAVLSIGELRANNEHMIKLRTNVYSADKNNDHVEEALKHLQSYVTSHMNTSLSGGSTGVYPPIQLKYTYDRLVQAESDGVAQSNNDFYTTAQKYCEAQNPGGFYGATRIGCVEDYLTTHDTKHQIAPIPDALYKFDFVSPSWSPDLAGWSIMTTILSAFLFIGSSILKRFK
jgi:hypothetical protein